MYNVSLLRFLITECTLCVCVQEAPLGEWEFRSKSKQNICSLEGGCKGYMFALEVTEVLETWPEHQNRGRRWVSVTATAIVMLCYVMYNSNLFM